MWRSVQATVVALLLLPVAALAGDERATFEFRYGDTDAGLRSRVTRELGSELGEIRERLLREGADRWDASDAGPLDIVLRHTTLSRAHPDDGRARVVIDLEDPGLPSSRAAVTELGELLIDEVGAWVLRLATARHDALRIEARTRFAASEADVERAVAELATLVANGDPRTTIELDRERLATTHRRAGELGVRLPVVRRQLEGARAAALRSVEAERIAASVEEFRRRIRGTEFESVRGDLEERLAPLLERLGELQATSPPLDVARRRVFTLEDELLGVESELELVSTEAARLREHVAEQETLLRRVEHAHARVERARTARERAQAELDRVDADLGGVAFELVRPVQPAPVDRSPR